MYFLELLLIALALGTDAFAVTLANGLAFSGENAGKRMAMPLTFGLFQGIMPLLGYFTVRLFSFDFSANAGVQHPFAIVVQHDEIALRFGLVVTAAAVQCTCDLESLGRF